MKQHHLRLLLLSLAVGGSSSAFAQSDLSYIFTARPKYTFSAALKIRTGGANVKFGNLGTILPSPVGIIGTGSNGLSVLSGYRFQDGTFGFDVARSNQVTSGGTPVVSGTQTTTTTNVATPSADGKRYFTSTIVDVKDSSDSTKNSTTTTNNGDYLAYQTGQTRNWSYQDASQVENGVISMHDYGSNSEGASKDAKAGSSGGFDLQLSRELGQIGKNIQWGFAFSFGVNEINAKTSGKITATLLTQTTQFSLLGNAAPTAPYSGPTFGPFILTDGNGQPLPDPTSTTGASQTNPTGTETTVPISSSPSVPKTTPTPGAAVVDGNWQVKGAYYMMRLGPSFRYQITKRVSISGNAGVAGSYIGSTYNFTESLELPAGVPNLPTSSTDSTPLPGPSISNQHRKQDFKLGYYGEVNAEFWITYRTGLFAGVVYEHLGKYSQMLEGRTADINIGGGTAFRIGIINRF